MRDCIATHSRPLPTRNLRAWPAPLPNHICRRHGICHPAATCQAQPPRCTPCRHPHHPSRRLQRGPPCTYSGPGLGPCCAPRASQALRQPPISSQQLHQLPQLRGSFQAAGLSAVEGMQLGSSCHCSMTCRSLRTRCVAAHRAGARCHAAACLGAWPMQAGLHASLCMLLDGHPMLALPAPPSRCTLRWHWPLTTTKSSWSG